MKIDYLRRRNGARVVTFATATPIANSVTEAYVMQRYLRPDLLDAAGIEVFDTWAATFGQVISQVELAPEGGSSFRMKSRFARFANVPEMLRMFHVAADVKTADDLALPVPDLTQRPDGQRTPETVTVKPSAELLDYVRDLGERAAKVRNRAVGPEADNMLKISGDGRRAALDLRLLRLPQTAPGKISAAADRIAALWTTHQDDDYFDPDGLPYPVRGSLQLLFCDLGTPGPGWNAYDELRGQLTARGLPPGQIRFIHEAKTDRDKAQLFAACRAGRIAVLVGSTEKMGVGTNVQDRAIALHHLDAPWRPADVAQREGRILRQGNLRPGSSTPACQPCGTATSQPHTPPTTTAKPANTTHPGQGRASPRTNARKRPRPQERRLRPGQAALGRRTRSTRRHRGHPRQLSVSRNAATQPGR